MERTIDNEMQRRLSRLELALTRSKLGDPLLFLLPYRQQLADLEDKIVALAERGLRRRTDHLLSVKAALEKQNPSVRLIQNGASLKEITIRLRMAARTRTSDAATRLAAMKTRLRSAGSAATSPLERRLAIGRQQLLSNDPHAVLERGYAIVTYGGQTLKDSQGVPVGATIEARLARGTLDARVERREPDGH